MKLHFTIRDLLWLTVVVALILGWWLDHRKLTNIGNLPDVLVASAVSQDDGVVQFQQTIDKLKAMLLLPDSKLQIPRAAIEKQIAEDEKHKKDREDSLRPQIVRRMPRRMELWLQSRSTTTN